MSRVTIQKYGKGNVERINAPRLNGQWRWKEIQKHVPLIFNRLVWNVDQGDSISLRSIFLHKAIGPLP